MVSARQIRLHWFSDAIAGFPSTVKTRRSCCSMAHIASDCSASPEIQATCLKADRIRASQAARPQKQAFSRKEPARKISKQQREYLSVTSTLNAFVDIEVEHAERLDFLNSTAVIANKEIFRTDFKKADDLRVLALEEDLVVAREEATGSGDHGAKALSLSTRAVRRKSRVL